MNKIEVRKIIESTLKSGSKSPGILDFPKILRLKSSLESCESINEVVAILEDNRSLISKSFGLADEVLSEGVSKIKVLEA